MGSWRKPKPPPPPPPKVKATLAIWVKDADTGAPIRNAPVDIVSEWFLPPVDAYTNGDGYAAFQVEVGVTHLVEVHAEGYGSVTQEVRFIGNRDVNFFLPRTVPPTPAYDLRPLHADGPLFRLPDGQIWRWKMVTAFDAVRLVHVKDFDRLKKYAKWTRDVGGNGWRIFGGWSRTGFDYRNIPDYFTRVLPDLNSFLRDEGLRGEFTAITDGIPSDEGQQADFLNRCLDVLADFLFFEYANEPWKNGLDPQRFAIRRAGRLVAKGAPPAGTSPYPYVPSMGYSAHHPPRDDEWFRKAGKDSYEIRNNDTHDVVVANEPIGFAEQSQGGSRSSDAAKAFIEGVSAAMFCPGVTAHGDTNTLQLCNVPGPNEDRCVREVFRGMDLVPLEAPLWQYGRYGPDAPATPMPIANDEQSDRLHAMVGGNQAVVCNYFPSPGWVAVGINGWRVKAQDGAFVLCER